MLVFISIVFVLRLFYLQVLQNQYYSEQAQASQLSRYEIPAERGSIYAYDGDEITPVVLNKTLYRVTADPEIIEAEDIDGHVTALSAVLDAPVDRLRELLSSDSRYEILATKQTKEVKETIEELALTGVFAHEKVLQRDYVNGSFAAHVLGFVNDSGSGNYGIEQALDDDLSGTPGRVKALTDQNNVPLLATDDNIQIDPIDGDDIVLTLDVSMQRQLEQILADGLKAAESESGSAIIMEADTGAIKAMAALPSFDPNAFASVEDPSVFTNSAVSTPLEPGSVMKVLMSAAAIDAESVSAFQTYADSGSVTVDGYTITNVAGGATPSTSVSDILRYSLNTGAVWLITQMGGGELNETARERWHEYLVDRYQFGKPTGIEQGVGSEAAGVVPDPNEGFGLDIKYANTAFGQGLTVTPLQMAAAVGSVVNGGTYYQPTLVGGVREADGSLTPQAPNVRRSGVVSPEVAGHIRDFMVNVVDNNLSAARRDGYRVGGKTGTAEIANPDGGYYEDRFNGTYVGFVGGERPEYIIMVLVDEPKIEGYAGSAAAAPIFANLSNMLIDNFAVSRVGE